KIAPHDLPHVRADSGDLRDPEVWGEPNEDNGEKSLPAGPSIISTWRPSTQRSSPLSRTSSRRPPHRRQHRGQTVLAGVGRDDVAHQPAANLLCLFQPRSRNMNVCPGRFTPGRGARWPTLVACNSRRFTSAGRRSCVDRPITWISSPLSAMAIYATNTKRVTDEMF